MNKIISTLALSLCTIVTASSVFAANDETTQQRQITQKQAAEQRKANEQKQKYTQHTDSRANYAKEHQDHRPNDRGLPPPPDSRKNYKSDQYKSQQQNHAPVKKHIPAKKHAPMKKHAPVKHVPAHL